MVLAKVRLSIAKPYVLGLAFVFVGIAPMIFSRDTFLRAYGYGRSYGVLVGWVDYAFPLLFLLLGSTPGNRGGW
jgi:hypothetical protein